MITADRDGPLITLVAAAAQNGVIGRDGGLAWRISDDLRWFKRMTLGKPVVMGRKTFDSIGRPLPGRDNIVLSGDSAFGPDGVLVAAGVEEALQISTACATAKDAVEICIIGGARIYEQFLERADRIYFTKVLAEVEGDVSFPAIYDEDWRAVRVGGCSQSEKNEHSCEFFILDRVTSSPQTLEIAETN